jgi:uncharacterized protein (TIGR02145 family)
MAEGTLEITISNQTIRVSAITVTGAGSATTITTDKGTLQMFASISPSDAYNDTMLWTVTNGSGTASIITLPDNTASLSAISDGAVSVRATAMDGSGVYDELVITISNQAAPTLVTTITVTSTDTLITTDRGTLQMTAHVIPTDATYQTVIWTRINGTGMATISTSGLLSALHNGTVTARAIATDGSGVYGEMVITISNQSVLLRVPDNFDFSLQDVVDVVVPSSGDALIGCFVDAGATIFDPTHVPGFDPRYEGSHERLTNFRNYPIDVNVNPSDPETLYNWYAANKHIAGGDVGYGALYNWYVVGTNKLAPTGWHVPSESEFETLLTFLDLSTSGGASLLAGEYLKESGTDHWSSVNVADNSSGFTATGSGQRRPDGSFDGLGTTCYLQVSENYASTGLLGLTLQNDNAFALMLTGPISPSYGCPIRCIMDGVDPADPGTVTDIDGNVYPTVKIGTQVWMAENLKVTKYNDGTDIPVITDDGDWVADTTGAMCYYDNIPPVVGEVTYLLPPAGYHIPTKAEYQTLANTLGGWLVAGGHLKQAGLTNWNDPNIGADNASGFDAIGTGYRDFLGYFIESLNYTLFWNLESYNTTSAYYSMLYHSFANFITSIGSSSFVVEKIIGASVRCLKDDSTDTGTVTDIDGNIYPTVKIGNQVWMALNLIVTHYNDGTDIPELPDANDWIADTDGARCYYS